MNPEDPSAKKKKNPSEKKHGKMKLTRKN